MTTRSRSITYWTTTLIIAFVLLSGGIASVLGNSDTIAGIVQLGYPAYLVTILGIWKLLGGLALLAPALPRLKEWAYAGAFFDFSGAVASRIAIGDDAGNLVAPALFAACTLVSWATRPPARRL